MNCKRVVEYAHKARLGKFLIIQRNFLNSFLRKFGNFRIYGISNSFNVVVTRHMCIGDPY